MERVLGMAVRLGAALVLAAPSPAAAAVIVVTTIVDATGGPECSLRDAIVAANENQPFGGCPAGDGDDLIDLTSLSGTMEVHSTLPTISAFFESTVIRGPGADRLAISGLDSHVVFSSYEVGSLDTTIERVTIRNGSPHCVRAEGYLTLRDCRVTACAGGGAAIDSGEFGSLVTIDRCLVDANGGPAVRVGGWTGMGGVWLLNSTLTGNQYGVVVSNAEGPGVLSRSYSSTIADNRIANLALQVDQRMHIEHTILMHHPGRPRRDPPGANCELGGTNLLPPGTPNLTSFASLSDDASCGLVGPGDLDGVDPLLGPLQDNGGPTWSRAPLANSPVIDAGESACTSPDGDLVLDQRGRGFVRPRPGAPGLPALCDLGAIEVPEPTASQAGAAGALACALLAWRRCVRGAR